MDLFKHFLKDKVLYEQYETTNQYNEKEYRSGIYIDCRIVKYSSVIENSKKELTKTNFKIYTMQAISKYDKLNNSIVLYILEYKSFFDGEVKGYKSLI